jgi:rhamnosyltransferase
MNHAAGAFCGVMVTFHPPEGVEKNCAAFVAECGQVVVVDNGSGEEVCRTLAAVPGACLISLAENRGVAQALNAGCTQAAELGYSWVIAFDQDSYPEPGFAAALWNSHLAAPQAAVVGPRIVENALGGHDHRWLRSHPWCGWWFQRAPCRDGDLTDVSVVMTSGSLIEMACWRALGGFDERLFIDCVDTDYCLRWLTAGRLSAGSRLDHQLGQRTQPRFLGRTFFPTNHLPIRHYHVARNRVLMLRRQDFRFPHWMFFDLMVAGLWLFRMLAFEQHKGAKLKAMVLGTWDRLRGRFGPCGARRMAALSP